MYLAYDSKHQQEWSMDGENIAAYQRNREFLNSQTRCTFC